MYEIMISWGYCREALEFFGLLRPRGGMYDRGGATYGVVGGTYSSDAGPSRRNDMHGSVTGASRQIRPVGGFQLAEDLRGNAGPRSQPQSSNDDHGSSQQQATAPTTSAPKVPKDDSPPPPSPPEMDPKDYFIGDFMTEEDDFIEEFH